MLAFVLRYGYLQNGRLLFEEHLFNVRPCFVFAAFAENALILEMHSLVSVRGYNITFRCEASRNATGRLETLNESVEIEWSFSPDHSNKSFVLLSPDKVQGNDVVNPPNDKVKYLRTMQTGLTITETMPQDAGTYTCRFVQQNVFVPAELYVIGE